MNPSPTIRVNRYRWATDTDEHYLHAIKADGAVEYVIEGVKCEANHEHDEDCYRHFGCQYFARGGSFKDPPPNSTIVWGRDGNREAPTLQPSFLCDWSPIARIHLFPRGGKIELCGDSTVVVE